MEPPIYRYKFLKNLKKSDSEIDPEEEIRKDLKLLYKGRMLLAEQKFNLNQYEKAYDEIFVTWSNLKNNSARYKILLIGIGLITVQQLSGINYIIRVTDFS